MRRQAAGWILVLAILAGAGVGGWFAGSKVVAPQPDAGATAFAEPGAAAGEEESFAAGVGRRRVAATESESPNETLVLGASEMSPFGHAEGLPGRQVLTGTAVAVRSTELSAEIDLQTPAGPATIAVRPGSTFTLRLSRAEQSALQPGAAVAVILNDAGDAVAVLALPADARPVLDPGG